MNIWQCNILLHVLQYGEGWVLEKMNSETSDLLAFLSKKATYKPPNYAFLCLHISSCEVRPATGMKSQLEKKENITEC